MIVVVEVIKAIQGKSLELKKALHDIVPVSRKEEGCLQYELFEPTKENGEFLILQKWKNSKDLDRHETSKTIEDFIRKYDGVLYAEVTQYTEWKPVV